MNIPEFGIYEYPDPRHNICSALINTEFPHTNYNTYNGQITYYVDAFRRNPVPEDILNFYIYYKEQVDKEVFIELDEKSFGYAYTLLYETMYYYIFNNVNLENNTNNRFKDNFGSMCYVYDIKTCKYENFNKMLSSDEVSKRLKILSKYDCKEISQLINRVNFNEAEITINGKKYCKCYNRNGYNIYVDKSIKNENKTTEIIRLITLDRFFTYSDDIITIIDSNYKLNFVKNNKVDPTPLNVLLKNVIHRSYVNLRIQHLSFNSPLINIGRCDTTIKYHEPKVELSEDYYNRLLEYKSLRKKYDEIELKSPEIVEGDFIAKGLNLASLKGCPKIVNGNFIVNNNHLKSFEGLPEHIGGYLDISNNELTDTAWEYAKENMIIDFNGYRMHHNMFNKYRKELY